MTVAQTTNTGTAVVNVLRAITFNAVHLQVRDADHPDPEDATDKSVGWAGKPGIDPFIPYVIVTPVTGTYDGDLASIAQSAIQLYQVMCVGASRQQATFIADSCRAQLLTLSNFSIPVARVFPEVERGVQADNKFQPTLFYAISQYRVTTL